MQKLLKSIKHWQMPVVALLGLWFAVSPWVLGTAGETRVVALSLVLGLALAAAAIFMAAPGHVSSAAWSGFVLGIVTMVSPWLVGHGDDMRQALNAVVTGLGAAVLSAALGFQVMDPDQWWNDRVAH